MKKFLLHLHMRPISAILDNMEHIVPIGMSEKGNI